MVSLLLEITNESSQPPASPTPIPTATASRKTTLIWRAVMLPASVATTATRSAVKAVPSLTRLSPSRIETRPLGSDAFLATVLTATASVGANTAPSASATATGIAEIQRATPPTASVVAITKPTASMSTGRRTRRISRNDEPSASPKTRGARIAIRKNSGSGAASGPIGSTPTTTPIASTGNAMPQPRCRAKIATTTAISAEAANQPKVLSMLNHSPPSPKVVEPHRPSLQK
ncbi:unannotated protein [freshwater metagenome]|uniref:Unannotated protein n=1 Tax=freshwater metagenome TaxID=449393 RepID=A0A6J6TS88_9ZZZZ